MNIQPKIVFLTPSFFPGGAEKIMLRLLSGLCHANFDMHLAVIWHTGPLKRHIPPEITIHNLNAFRTRNVYAPLITLLRRLKPALIFSSISRINLTLLSLKSFFPKIKFIVREPSIPSLSLFHYQYAFIYRFGYKYLYPKADKIICQSHYMKKDLNQSFYISSRKIDVIYNPVLIPPPSCPLNQEPFPLLNPNDLNIVACGRLSSVKGFDLLITAFAIMVKQRQNIRLLIIGDGPEKKKLVCLRDRLELSKVISFLSYTNHPSFFFDQADLFVSTSKWEGLPNVILEAMACGTPVVAIDCPGGTKEIIQEGVNGWLVPKRDPKMLATALISALVNIQTLDQSKITQSINQFSEDRIIKQYHDLFFNIINT